MKSKEDVKTVLDEFELEEMIDPEFEGIPKGLLIPTGNKVVIKPIKQGQYKTGGGIIIPESTPEMLQIGILYRTGPLVPEYLKPGMRVAYSKNVVYGFYHNSDFYHNPDVFMIEGIIPPGNYFPGYYPTFEHRKREERIDNQKHAHEVMNNKIDAIQNGEPITKV